MNEMINYIFENMKHSDGEIQALKKALKKQRRTDCVLKVAVVTLALYAYSVKVACDEHERRIGEMRAELDELSKGE